MLLMRVCHGVIVCYRQAMACLVPGIPGMTGLRGDLSTQERRNNAIPGWAGRRRFKDPAGLTGRRSCRSNL